MEDSTLMDLMIDTDEYLIEDWECDFTICTETTTKTSSQTGTRTGYEARTGTDSEARTGTDSEAKTGIGSETATRIGSETGLEPVAERPAKQLKTNNKTSTSSSSPSSSSSRTSQVISFGSPDPKGSLVETSLNFSNQISNDQKVESNRKDCGNNNGGRREPHLLKEHVLAERKRRQKLNERLIALSALLPGLKKTDKATVLEDAIKLLKQLQERVKKYEEEQIGTKKMDQSVILVKRSQLYLDDDSSSYSSTCSAASPLSSSSSDEVSILKQTMPMIEARVSDRDLLIRIHCENIKGCLIKILTSLEKFRLHVVNSFTLPFGNSTLVVTILTKMDNKFSQPIEEVVKNIRVALDE